MTILDEIIERKREEVEQRKRATPISVLKDRPLYNKQRRSMAESIKNSGSGIIAEFKRCSPSVPEFPGATNVADVVSGYASNGAAGISVLTDEPYFGGNLDDLELAASTVDLPILRKDFMIDAYQMEEARAYGADAILLIAAALPADKTYELTMEAASLGLEVILEVHNKEELELHANPFVHIIGVNNRNLKEFKTDIQTSIDLIGHIPAGPVKISESGINTAEDIEKLSNAGFDGFLIGGSLLKTDNPAEALSQFKTQHPTPNI